MCLLALYFVTISITIITIIMYIHMCIYIHTHVKLVCYSY